MAGGNSFSSPKFSSSVTAGALIGIGLMAAIDEIVFHQLLGWHHFYDGATPAAGLFTDGLLHSGELLLLVAGFFMLSSLRARQSFARRGGWAGLFIGMGGFQLFDGIVDHKVLQLHQIRYDVSNLLAYDIAWNGAALILLAIGLLLARRPRSTSIFG